MLLGVEVGTYLANLNEKYEIKVDEGRFCRKAFEAKVEAFLEKHPEKSSLRRRMGALSLKDM